MNYWLAHLVDCPDHWNLVGCCQKLGGIWRDYDGIHGFCSITAQTCFVVLFLFCPVGAL